MFVLFCGVVNGLCSQCLVLVVVGLVSFIVVHYVLHHCCFRCLNGFSHCEFDSFFCWFLCVLCCLCFLVWVFTVVCAFWCAYVCCSFHLDVTLFDIVGSFVS